MSASTAGGATRASPGSLKLVLRAGGKRMGELREGEERRGAGAGAANSFGAPAGAPQLLFWEAATPGAGRRGKTQWQRPGARLC